MLVYQRVKLTPLVQETPQKTKQKSELQRSDPLEPPGQQEHSGIVELQCSHLCFHLPEQIRFLEKDMIGRPS